MATAARTPKKPSSGTASTWTWASCSPSPRTACPPPASPTLHARLFWTRPRQHPGLLRAVWPAAHGPRPQHPRLDAAPGAAGGHHGGTARRQARLQADGIEVIGPTDHTLFQSIYFFDPSGHRLELAVNTGTPEMLQKLDEVKWDMLNEWARTKKAPSTLRGCTTAATAPTPDGSEPPP